MLSWTNPVSTLCARTNCSTLCRDLKVLGKIPLNELELVSKTVKFPRLPISIGKHPTSLLLETIISFKVFPILPMLLGRQPWKWLLAMTKTETGELPKVCGMVDVKRLLFKNKASNSLLKSSGGSWPSKSLYLRSRYLRFGIERTTVGKEPTNRLLLTSSS